MLWLPAWYPGDLDAFNGDFIQRHARAVALYCKVHVICMVPDSKGTITRNVRKVESVSGNLVETIIYYRPKVILPGVVGKFFSRLRYLRIYKKAVRNYLVNHGKPNCVHVHVADKNGLIALWLKKTMQIPFLLSEHWTIYLKESDKLWSMQPWWFKRAWNRIISETDGISVVSDYQGKAMQAFGAPENYKIIPNVVDHNIFFPADTSPAPVPLFLHVSMLNYQKNFEAVLEAFSGVKRAGHPFRLDVYGPAPGKLRKYAQSLDLGKEVQFQGEVPQAELAERLRQATALVHYSRYETFGCVIIEAHASGIPVIASDIPVHHETITEGVNGFFVRQEYPAALAGKIIEFIQQRRVFPKKEMYDATVKLYSYEVVGRRFYEWYQSLTSNIK